MRLLGSGRVGSQKGGQSHRAVSSRTLRSAPQRRDEERLCGFRFKGDCGSCGDEVMC